MHAIEMIGLALALALAFIGIGVNLFIQYLLQRSQTDMEVLWPYRVGVIDMEDRELVDWARDTMHGSIARSLNLRIQGRPAWHQLPSSSIEDSPEYVDQPLVVAQTVVYDSLAAFEAATLVAKHRSLMSSDFTPPSTPPSSPPRQRLQQTASSTSLPRQLRREMRSINQAPPYRYHHYPQHDDDPRITGKHLVWAAATFVAPPLALLGWGILRHTRRERY